MRPLKEHLLRLSDSILDSDLWILGEVLIPDYQLVQLVSKEVGTSSSSVAIVNGEERASRPLFDLLELRLDDVENDGHPVFIVVPDDSLVCVSGIATDNSVLLASELGRVVGLDVPVDLLLLHLHVFLLLLYGHDKPSVLCQLILALRLCQS